MYTYTYIVICIHVVACRHQDITWTNVDLSKFCVTYRRPILQEVLKMSISNMVWKVHLWNDFHIPQGTPKWRMSFHFFIKVSMIRWFLSWDLSLVAPNPVPCYLVTPLQIIWKSGISKKFSLVTCLRVRCSGDMVPPHLRQQLPPAHIPIRFSFPGATTSLRKCSSHL